MSYLVFDFSMIISYIGFKQRQNLIARKRDAQNILQLISLFPVTSILGARQCGKTTLAKTFNRDHYFDLEDPADATKIRVE